MESNPPIVTMMSNKLGIVFGLFDAYILAVLFSLMTFNFSQSIALGLILSVLFVWLLGMLAGRYEFSRIYQARLIIFLLIIVFVLPIIRSSLIHTEFAFGDILLEWWSFARYFMLYLFVVSCFKLKRATIYVWVLLAFMLVLLLFYIRDTTAVPEVLLGVTLLLLFWVYYAYKKIAIKIGALLVAALLVWISYLYGGMNLHPLIALAFLSLFIVRMSGFIIAPIAAVVVQGAITAKELAKLNIDVSSLANQLAQNVVDLAAIVVVGAGLTMPWLEYKTGMRSLFDFMGLIGLIVFFVVVGRFLVQAYTRYRNITIPSLKSYFLVAFSMLVYLLLLITFVPVSELVEFLPIVVVFVAIAMCAYETNNQ